jgi:SSS family solute:Na+ symporter
MWRVASESRLRTVGDFLELRYGAGVRVALTGLLLVATLFVLAAQLLAAGVLIEGAAGIPLPLAILAAALVMTAYFAVGGLQSAASVNFVQLGVLLAGLGLAVPYALAAAGGGPGIQESLGEGSLDVFGSASLAFGYTALLIPAFLVSPGILQKLFGAGSEKAVRRGLAAAGVALLAFAAVPPLLGAAAAALHPGLANADAALPVLLIESLPLWLGCLGVAALFSAEVSSADAVLFMLSTSLSRDVFHRFVRPDADDRTVLRVARAAAVVSGLAGVVIAILAQSVIASLTIFYSVLGVSLFVPVVVGLHRYRPPARAILSGAAVGVFVFWLAPADGSLPPPLIGIAASAVVVLLHLRNSGR